MRLYPVLMKLCRVTQARPSVLVILFTMLLSATAGLAEVIVEVKIVDQTFPARPPGRHLTLFDLGDGGECARAAQVIGAVYVRLKAPLDAITIEGKINDTEPELLKSGADGIIITNFTVHEFSAKGYVESATLVCSVIHFTDEPSVDRRSEADLKALLKAKVKPEAIEGIWVDQNTKQRVAIFEDPAQKGHYVGVQFDNGNQPDVPNGLIVADFRLQADGWLTGHFTFDNYKRNPTRLRMPSGDEFKIPIKICTNGYVSRAYPDKFPPEYRLLNLSYSRDSAR